MKKAFLIPLIIFSLVVGLCVACTRDHQDKTLSPVSKDYYRFANHLIDLASFTRVPDTTAVQVINEGEQQFAPHHENIFFKGKKFSITPDHAISIIDLATKKEKILRNKADQEYLANTTANADYQLFETHDGIVYVMRLGTQFIIYKYNEEGDVRFRVEVEHTFIDRSQPDVNYYKPYLDILQCIDGHLILSSLWHRREKQITKVIDLADGSVREWPLTIMGIVLDEKNQLNGMIGISADEKTFTYYSLTGGAIWSETHQNYQGVDSTEALLHGDALIITEYSAIAMGATTKAIDLKTGKIKWTFNSPYLVEGHSEYYNAIKLTQCKNLVILHAEEAGGSYVVIIDATSGQTLYQEIIKS